MSIPGAETLLQDMTPAWRRACSAAAVAVFVTAFYFTVISGPIANAATQAAANSHRIDGVQNDIREIKGSVAELQEKQAANGQKLEDLKDSVDSINNKLDRLLLQNQRRAQYP